MTKKASVVVATADLLAIPDKRYFTIGEVSTLCALKPHVLRYWEQEFPQLKPTKRRGNRRYYQHEDIIAIRKIRHLLYEKGFTLSGARAQLIADKKPVLIASNSEQQLVAELKHILAILN